MEVNGMKRNKEADVMNPKIKVSLKILPFGNISYKIAGLEHPIEEKESEMPRYIEPLTTNIEKVDIYYEESETYLLPKTTACR